MKISNITTEQPLVKKFNVLEKGIKVITDDKEHPYPHSRLGPDVDIGSHEDTTHPYVIPSSQQVDANGNPIYGAEAGMRWYGQETPAGMDTPSDHELIQQLIGELEGELENGAGWGDEEGSGYVPDGDGDAGAGDGEGHGDGPYTGDGTGEGPYTGQDGDYGPEIDVTDGNGGEGEHGAGDGSSIDDGPAGDGGDGSSGEGDSGPTTQGDPDAQAGPLTPEIRPDIVIPPPVIITPGQDDTPNVPNPEPDDDDKPEADDDDPLEHGHGDEVHSHEDGDQEHDHDEDEDEEGDVEDGTDVDVDPDADEGEDESPTPNDPEGDSPQGGPGVGDDPSGVPIDPESTPEPDEEGGVDMGPIDGPADPNVFVAELNPDGSWKISPEELELQLAVIQARQYSQNEGNHFTDVRFPHMSFDENGELSAMFPPDGKPTLFMGSGPTRTELDRGTYDSGKPIPDYYYFSKLTTAVRDTEHVEGYIDPVNGVWPKNVMDIIKAEALEIENESIDFSRLENKLRKIQERLASSSDNASGKINLSPDNTPKKKQDNQSGNYTGQDSIFGDGVKVVTYIGPNASGWNNTAYLKAVELQKQGASEDEIWQQTRTVFDPIGHPHQEITDHELTLMGKPEGWEYGGRTTLDQVIDHPELFKNYPQLRNIEVWHDTISYGGTADGWTSSDGKTIGLKHMPGFSEMSIWGKELQQRQKEILLHEIYHAIDIIEGRIPDIGPWGSESPTSPRIRRVIHDDTGIPKWEIYAGSTIELGGRDTANRAELDDKERSENTPRLHGGSEEDGGVPKTVIIKGPFDMRGDSSDDYEVIDNPNINKPPYKPKGRDESINFFRLEKKLNEILKQQ